MVRAIRVLLNFVAGALFAIFLLILGFTGWLWNEARRHPLSGNEIPSVIQADSTLGYRLRSNLDVVYPVLKGVLWRTNDQGVRSPLAAGRIDHPAILLIGDSQTFGFSVPYEVTYGARLAATFHVSVMNAAVPGWGPASELLATRQWLRLRPKIVILGWYYEHAVRALSPCYPGSSTWCVSVPYYRDGYRFVPPHDNASTLREMQAYQYYLAHGPHSIPSDMLWIGRGVVGNYATRLTYRRVPPGPDVLLRVINAALTEFAAQARVADAAAIVLYIPDYFGPHVVPAPDYLRRTCESLGLALVDPSPLLEAARQAGTQLFVPGIGGDGHLNADGHAILETALRQTVRDVLSRSAVAGKLR